MEYKYLLTISRVENTYPSSQPAAASSYIILSQIHFSTSTVSPSSSLAASFTSYSKRPEITKSIQEVVKNYASSISIHNNPDSSSDDNNLQTS